MTVGSARVRVGAVVAVAVAVGIVVWLLVGGSNNGTTPKGKRSVAAVSEQGLRTLAATFRSPIYWTGPRAGTKYELTQTPSGRVFVRYLPPGVPVGSTAPHLFVATFPVANAFAATQGVANRSGSIKLPLSGAGIAFYSRSSPTNVYLAFPGSNYQIEVFDPDPAAARNLVQAGSIQPVSWSAPGATTGYSLGAASVARLMALPGQLGHPLYWMGDQPGRTYELTQTANGRVFVRYLPAGAKVGTGGDYPFVGTLPVQNAFAATTGVANRADSVKIPAAGGAVAFYARSRPTNIYLAFHGSDYQIEVFDPNPQQARTLVSAGRITQIP